MKQNTEMCRVCGLSNCNYKPQSVVVDKQVVAKEYKIIKRSYWGQYVGLDAPLYHYMEGNEVCLHEQSIRVGES